MARKAVLEGGKKDEIVKSALELFLKNGYEATTVRMILNKVDGEVGMFYHYFKSKEELFDETVRLFLRQYGQSFSEILDCSANSTDIIFDALSNLLKNNINKYKKITHTNFHWSMQIALNELTVISIVPHVTKILEKLRNEELICPTVPCSDRELAGYILYGARAILHEKNILEIDENELNEKLDRIKELTRLILNPASKEASL